MAGIGYVCIQWAMLETVLAHIIFTLLDMDHETGAIAFGGLDMQPRATMAINLARHQKAPKQLVKELEDIRKEIRESLADRRNQAVHGVHSDASMPEAVKLTMMRWKKEKRTSEVTATDLQRLGLEISRQATAAIGVFADLGKWKFGGHRFENPNHSA